MQSNITFLQLIEDQRIEIPEIQRDYAQGREEERVSELRSNFLGALYDILSAESYSAPLVLDFVYGSSENGGFKPLDGQQRLTTLFLLHWYLADETGLDKLRESQSGMLVSRFSYHTRLSSKSFCNELVKYSLRQMREDYVDSAARISDIIRNRSWFAWDWAKDPTVAGMLVMLDAMDEQFKGCDKNLLWQRLEEGRVVFHLLNLGDFALSDKLYVKMNARGKELSGFDLLKSTLEEQMRVNKVRDAIQEDWRKKVDSAWMDLFWESAKSGGGEIIKEVETRYLRFLERIMVFHLFTDENPFKGLDSDKVTKELKRLGIVTGDDDRLSVIREKSINDVSRFVNLFCKTGFFDESFFTFATETLDGIIYGSGKDITSLIEGVSFDDSTNPRSLFDQFTDGTIDYAKRVQFFAVACFVKYHNAEDVFEEEAVDDEFNEWMRVVRNLSVNTTIYHENFGQALAAIREWCGKIYSPSGCGSVLESLRLGELSGGFNKEQRDEEIRKAELLASPHWRGAIRQAEEHLYFLGQIRFLLDWADGNLDAFDTYFQKMNRIFDRDGVRDGVNDGHKFRRALLACGHYYMEYGYYGFSLLSKRGRGDRSWKQMLRNQGKAAILKTLLDQSPLDEPLQDAFQRIIDNSNVQDWRRYFILRPEIFRYQQSNKMIQRWRPDIMDGEIIVLQKERASGPHVELRTYYWQIEFGNEGDYLDSKHEHPYSAFFPQDGGGDVSVKYVANGWAEGRYIVSASEQRDGLEFSTETNRWEKNFPTSEYQQVEDLLKSLL